MSSHGYVNSGVITCGEQTKCDNQRVCKASRARSDDKLLCVLPGSCGLFSKSLSGSDSHQEIYVAGLEIKDVLAEAVIK